MQKKISYSLFNRIFWKFKSIYLIIKTRLDPKSIPIIIISFNRLDDLKKLVDFLIIRKFKNIVIVDNNSSYPPLLQFYKEMEGKIMIVKRNSNGGHLVFWQDRELFLKFGLGYYVVTDSDILPNPNLPENFIESMLSVLHKNPKITKVGFALGIDNIPDYYPLKSEVLKWEKKFWENLIAHETYLAQIDTTFAIYRPKYLLDKNFYNGIRIGGLYTAKHGGWYIDPNQLTDEEKYYSKVANHSNSWTVDKERAQTQTSSKKYFD